jgi:hypothetical protein
MVSDTFTKWGHASLELLVEAAYYKFSNNHHMSYGLEKAYKRAEHYDQEFVRDIDPVAVGVVVFLLLFVVGNVVALLVA